MNRAIGAPVHLLVPESGEPVAGGEAADQYVRRIAESLRTRCEIVSLHQVSGPWPYVEEESRRVAEVAVTRIPDDAVLLVDGRVLPAAAQALWVERHRLRVAALVHWPLHLEPGLDPERAAGLERLERMALAQVRRVLVPGRACADAVGRLGVPEQRVGLVPAGTDWAPARRGCGTSEPCLICPAPLVPDSGHAILFAALRMVADLPWRLVLAGSDTADPRHVGWLRGQLADMGLADRTAILGAVSTCRMEELWRQADLCVLPLWRDGHGLMAADALMRGLPVVASDAGVLPEIVDARAGAIVPVGDAAAMASELRQLLADPHRRGCAGQAARVLGAGLPGWDVATDRVRSELSRIVPRDLRIERIA